MVQVYTYYIAFPADKWSLKLLVYGVFVLELMQTFMATHDAVVVYGRGFNNPLVFDQVHLLWITIPLLGGLGEHYCILFRLSFMSSPMASRVYWSMFLRLSNSSRKISNNRNHHCLGQYMRALIESVSI